ncbi:hypothetical protein KSP40_PGU004752 [Platanthera guangdongensis]|uniref:Uncharacterized protein n=1 Tax=Platanthera guangdongensis TaxID=2320717 RepID=A0ABR2LHM0_9ASPA
MRTTDENNYKEACLRNCSCKAALFRYNGDLTACSCYPPSEIFSLMINKPVNLSLQLVGILKGANCISSTYSYLGQLYFHSYFQQLWLLEDGNITMYL